MLHVIRTILSILRRKILVDLVDGDYHILHIQFRSGKVLRRCHVCGILCHLLHGTLLRLLRLGFSRRRSSSTIFVDFITIGSRRIVLTLRVIVLAVRLVAFWSRLAFAIFAILFGIFATEVSSGFAHILLTIATSGICAVFVIFLLFLLRAFVLLFAPLSKITRQCKNIVPCFSVFHSRNEWALFGVEFDFHTSMNAHLEMNIQAVNQGQRIGIIVAQTKEITVMHLSITITEVMAKARKLRFDTAFDTRIFDHIDVLLGNAKILVDFAQIFDKIGICLYCWSIEGMCHFMADEHIVQRLGCALPHGQRQLALFDIKARRGRVRLMAHGDVFGREQFSKDAGSAVVGVVDLDRLGHGKLLKIPLYFTIKSCPCGGYGHKMGFFSYFVHPDTLTEP